MSVETRTVLLTSDGSGDASGSINCNGILRGIALNSVVTPTDQWDVAVTDGNGTALFTDTGVGSAANEFAIPSVAGTVGANGLLYPVAGSLSVVGANMGNAKSANVIFYVEV